VLNMSGSEQKISLDLASRGIRAKSGKTVLASFSAPAKTSVAEISIAPFGAWVLELE